MAKRVNPHTERTIAQTYAFNGGALSDKGTEESVLLRAGSYLVEFSKTVEVSLDLKGQLRSGALLNAGVMDSAYKGAVSAMLQVIITI